MDNMKKKIFNPQVGDWIVNNDSTFTVTEIIAKHTRVDETMIYNLSLKNVINGLNILAYDVEMMDDDSVNWLYSTRGFFGDPVVPDPKIVPMIEWSDDDILDYIIKKLARFTRLQAEAEYWFTQVVCSTNEDEKKRAAASYQFHLIDSIRERKKTRNSLLTNEKLCLLNSRFTYLWNKAQTVVRAYATDRARMMRYANGICTEKGLIKYVWVEEEEEK